MFFECMFVCVCVCGGWGLYRFGKSLSETFSCKSFIQTKNIKIAVFQVVLFIIIFVFHNWQTGPRMLKNMSEHNITGGDPTCHLQHNSV